MDRSKRLHCLGRESESHQKQKPTWEFIGMLERLQRIFQTVMHNPTITITPETSADDIPEWDSFNHVVLFAAIEEDFGVQFSTDELIALNNVGLILWSLNQKVSPSKDGFSASVL
jgi:acyl carrier protein